MSRIQYWDFENIFLMNKRRVWWRIPGARPAQAIPSPRLVFVKLDKIRRFLVFWAGSECKGFRFLLLLMTQRERTVGLVPRLRRSDPLRDRYPSPSGLG